MTILYYIALITMFLLGAVAGWFACLCRHKKEIALLQDALDFGATRARQLADQLESERDDADWWKQ